MRVLLTAFDRFGQLDTNPTESVVRNLVKRERIMKEYDIITEVLPVEFSAAGNRIQELLDKLKPQAVVSLGVEAGIGTIKLERVALNLDDDIMDGNVGEIVMGRHIIEHGPVAYWSTLPLERMCEVLLSHGIPTIISTHAGTYLCNHVFYLARHRIESQGTGSKCGFIHVPLISKQPRVSTASSLPLAVICDAVELCLDVIQKDAYTSSKSEV